jgi:hypothetical protein
VTVLGTAPIIITTTEEAVEHTCEWIDEACTRVAVYEVTLDKPCGHPTSIVMLCIPHEAEIQTLVNSACCNVCNGPINLVSKPVAR